MDFQQLELSLIQEDMKDLKNSINALKIHELAGYLVLGLSPMIGFIAEESHNYLQSRNLLSPSISLFANFQTSITKLRALLKLFEDNDGGQEGLIATLRLFQEKSSLWMNRDKTGFHRFITQNILQPDIGVYFLSEAPVYMTSVAFSAIGKTKEEVELLQEADFEDISVYARAFGEAIGEYVFAIEEFMKSNGIEANNSPLVQGHFSLSVSYNDFRSKKLYNTIKKEAKLKRSEVSAALLFILCQVNIAHVLLPLLLHEDSNLLIRLQFLTNYHSVKSLLQIKDDVDTDLANLLPTIDFSSSIPNSKKVRNVLAHYGLGEGTKFISTGGDPLGEVVQGFSGISKKELGKLANHNLGQISKWTEQRFSKTRLKNIRALLGNHT